MSQANERLKIQMALKAEIIKIMEWDELGYCNFQFEQGLKYLSTYIGDEDYKLKFSPIFWSWWKNQWALRDEEITISGVSTLCLQIRRMVYLDFHDGKKLATAIRPQRFILEQSYIKMTSEVIKESVSIDPNQSQTRAT